jgi:membrane-associated phospholipid phosphatase
MRSTTDPKGIQRPSAATTAGGESRQEARRWYPLQAVLWIIGIIVFAVSCFFVHAHPSPFAIDLSLSQIVQHASLPSWADTLLRAPSVLNNPLPSLLALASWCIFMLVMGLIFYLRGKSPLVWLQNAVFLALAVLSSSGLNVLMATVVGRPRPDPHKYPIHVSTAIVPFPSFPSGHTEHDIVYYGFLLYLSFTKPVREWHYRWLLIPLQVLAVFDILAIGYSRVLEGDHWFTDVLGGYLEGLLYLFLCIFIYRWVTNYLERWREKHSDHSGLKRMMSTR